MAREMKDSGVAWVGKIPISWSCQKLKYFAKINSGEMISKEEYVCDGKFPIIGSNGEIGRTDKYNNFESVITTGRVGTVGSTHIAEESWITDNALIIRNRNIFQKFLAYIIPNFDFKYMLSGTAQPLITATKLKDQFIPVPSSEVQIEIVSLLDKKCGEIDAVLDKTRTSIEEYKKLKQAIITQAVTKGVRGDRPMKESGAIWLDTVPAEWTISKIKYTIFPKEKPVLPMDEVITCFRDGTVTLRRNRREEGFTISFTENGYQGVDVGDLVIHGMDTFAGAIGCSDSRGKTSPVVHVCSTVGNNRYFMYFLRYMAYSGVLMDFSNGVRIRSSDFRNFKKLAVFEMLVPPLREQNKIVDYLDSTLAKIDQVIKQKEILISELEACKKSAIYEYVTGKKEVPNAY